MIGTFWEKSPSTSLFKAEMHGLCALDLLARVVSGCDFFREETDTQIHKRTGENNSFKMAYFAYLWITPHFCCYAGHR
jgi:hypothetical protein